jgi:hypothetical protein
VADSFYGRSHAFRAWLWRNGTAPTLNLLRNSGVASDKTLPRLSFLFALRPPYQLSLPNSR